jgi:hypothetical protein
MKNLLFLALLLTATAGCTAQPKQNEKTDAPIAKTEQNKPEVNWKVNKKYDDKGNLIGYDSTYTWSYSSRGKVRQVEADSVLTAFRKQFNTEMPSFFNRNFADPVWGDSLLYKDFAEPDYFMKKWENHYFDMRGMMQEMDSLRNSFLKKNYPGLRTETNPAK